MRFPVLLLPVVLLCGCASRADQVFTAPGRLVAGSSGAQPGYGIKMVTAKQARTEAVGEAVGDDGSICRLTPERFDEVDVGEWLACEWTIAPDTTTIAPAERS